MATKADSTETDRDELDRFVAQAKQDPRLAIMLMLWVARTREPDCYVKLTEHDVKGFQDCVNYLKVKPDVLIHREGGQPAHGPIPARGNRRGIPAREATPAKPYAVVALVEKGTMNAIRPVENNQEDFDRSQELAQIKRARDLAPDLAARLLHASRSGDFSSSDLQDAANALSLLCRT